MTNRYKRLMFGISCAPELFQKVMESVVAGLKGIIVYIDDIFIHGRTQKEHDERLRAVLARLSDYGVLLNERKCIFNVTSLEFVGHRVSVDGVRPTESRIDAIQKFREPHNVSELRSFLGLVCYIGRFIPDLATRTDSLRQLLRAGVPFKWTDTEKADFEGLKAAICKIDYLGFFNPRNRTKLMADASPTGLGAVLLQEDLHGTNRVIAFASKSLTDVEKKYFQTEREALALVWSVEKFKLYLQATKFTLLTDCRALQFLFNPRSRPCARIERWVLRLQAYNYEIEHISGSTNIADALSRLSVVPSEHFDVDTQEYIRSVAEQAVPVALTGSEIATETKKDDNIQAVVKALGLGSKEDLPKEYKPYAAELCEIDGVLLRGNRLVIPLSLRDRVIELAHEAHPGIAAMKRRLRQKVWWPLIDKEAEACVKRCKQCTLVSTLGAPEPLLRTKMPTKPWTDIAVDFMGPLPSGHNLLVIVDYYSRFTEAVVMRQITAKHTIQALHETFCRFGIPETMRADNGPQFISEELSTYCREYGIQLRRTTPYWPQANGEVERTNKTILKHLKISQESGSVDWIWDLRSFLLMYNSTPHATTGAAPSLLMFGRILRDKLPSFENRKIRVDEEEFHDRDWSKKLHDAEYTNAHRHAKPTELKEGEIVVVKRTNKTNKLSSTFAPEEFEITKLTGSDAMLKSTVSNRVIHRNTAHLKSLMKFAPSHGPEKNVREDEGDTPAQVCIRRSTDPSAGMEPVDQNINEEPLNPPIQQELVDRPTRSHRKPKYLTDYEY